MAAAAGVKVCAVGDFTSKLAASYLHHIIQDHVDGSSSTVKEQLQNALESVDLPVTANIVSNLLKTVDEHRQERVGSESKLPLSWGEFCAFSIELYSHQSKTPISLPISLGKQEASPCYHFSPACKHEVFLGGSCNPTTWRKDTAIPVLHGAGITYFNPQVDEWFPELIEVEEQAKMAASLLFFVVDNQTRAISSMVEVAYVVGQGRDLIAVVEDISIKDPALIAGETLSSREVEDLNRGRLFLRNIVEEGGCLLANSMTSALMASQKVVKEKISVKHYCSQLKCRKLECVPLCVGEELHLLSRVFSMYDNDKKNRLSLCEAELALRSLHIEGPTLNQLQQGKVAFNIVSRLTSVGANSFQQYKQHGLAFDEFCSVYAELKHLILESEGSASFISTYIYTPLKWISSWLWSETRVTSPVLPPFVDVFLNGSCGSTTWRSDVSIPILKQYGVSYFNPQVANWDRRLLPIEREAKERCSVLLYVITGSTLSVASMVEAAYYIGQGRSVVLCISDIPSEGQTTLVEGMELTQRALKDYNRGRTYLTSMANKSRVPVYNSVSAATMSAIQLSLCLRGQKVQNHQLYSLISPAPYTTSV